MAEYINAEHLTSYLNTQHNMCEAYQADAARGSDRWWAEEHKKRVYQEVLDKVKWTPKVTVTEMEQTEQPECKHYKKTEVNSSYSEFERGVAYAEGRELPRTVTIGRCYAQKWTPRCHCNGDGDKCEIKRIDLFNAMRIGNDGETVQNALDKIVIRSEQE